MKLQKSIVFGVVITCLFLNSSLSSASSRVQSNGNLQWGAAVNGLQLSITDAHSNNLQVPEFQVAFRNVGTEDVTLNLGFMLANGKVQLPQNISLNVTDAVGQTRKLKFSDRRYAGVFGRLDDYVVPLRAGSTYTLKLRIDQFWSPDTKEFEWKFPPGKYQVMAQFEGSGAKISNPDVIGIKLMNFWLGTLRSNLMVVEW
jgi:hypothetical protein